MPRPPKRAISTDEKRTGTIDVSALTGLIGFHLREAQIAVFRDFGHTLGELEVSPVIFAVLALIDANRGLKQTALAKAVRLDRSSMVSVLDNLERRGLVERRTVDGDRRSHAIGLTPAGTALLRTAKRRVTVHEKRLARDLSAAERRELVALLRRILPEYR
jgi:DNA-binding MarR family transcriptional regulator